MIFIKVLCNLGKPKPFSLVSDDGSKWIKLNDHDMYRGLKLNLVSRKFPLVSRFKIVPCINAGSFFDFYAFFMFQLFSVKWLNKEGGGLIHLMSKEKLLKIFRKPWEHLFKNYFKKNNKVWVVRSNI